MAKEAKIVWITPRKATQTEGAPMKSRIELTEAPFGKVTPEVDAETYLAELLNDGWQIVAAGGSGEGFRGFIVLQRET